MDFHIGQSNNLTMHNVNGKTDGSTEGSDDKSEKEADEEHIETIEVSQKYKKVLYTFMKCKGPVSFVMNMLGFKEITKFSRLGKTFRKTVLTTSGPMYNNVFLPPGAGYNAVDTIGYANSMSKIDESVPLNMFQFNPTEIFKKGFQDKPGIFDKLLKNLHKRSQEKLKTVIFSDFLLKFSDVKPTVIFHKDLCHNEDIRKQNTYEKKIAKYLSGFRPKKPKKSQLKDLWVAISSFKNKPYVNSIFEVKGLTRIGMFIHSSDDFKANTSIKTLKSFFSKIEMFRVEYEGNLADKGKEILVLLKGLPKSIKHVEAVYHKRVISGTKNENLINTELKFSAKNLITGNLEHFSIGDLKISKADFLRFPLASQLSTLIANLGNIQLNDLRSVFEHTKFEHLKIMYLWNARHLTGEVLLNILLKSVNLKTIIIENAIISSESLRKILKVKLELLDFILWRGKGFTSKDFIHILIDIEKTPERYPNSHIFRHDSRLVLSEEGTTFRAIDKDFISKSFEFPGKISWVHQLRIPYLPILNRS